MNPLTRLPEVPMHHLVRAIQLLALSLAPTHADIIDDFSVTSLPPLSVTVPQGITYSEVYGNTPYEFDQSILNDYRYIAIRVSTPGTATAEISLSRLNFTTTSDSTALLLYNQQLGEPPNLNLSHLFTSGLPQIEVDFTTGLAAPVELLFALQTTTGRILVRQTLQAGTTEFRYPVTPSDISAELHPPEVSSIRLFLTFSSPTSLSIERYSLTTSDLGAAPATSLILQQSTPGVLSLDTSRTIIGYQYSLRRSSDLSSPVNEWLPLDTKPGNGGSLNWSFPITEFGSRQFFTLIPTQAPSQN